MVKVILKIYFNLLNIAIASKLVFLNTGRTTEISNGAVVFNVILATFNLVLLFEQIVQFANITLLGTPPIALTSRYLPAWYFKYLTFSQKTK